MRKCLRCNTEMVEGLDLKIKASGLKMCVAEKGTSLGSHPLSDIKLAVCPKCGYTESYVEETSKIKQLVKHTNE